MENISKKRLDLIGKKYNHLTVVKLDEEKTKEKKATYFYCTCDCGNLELFSVKGYDIKSGAVKRCKECKNKLNAKSNLSHGMKNTRIYSEWMGMKSRCKGYKHEYNIRNYTLRGIKVCDEWLDKDTGFKNFYNWAMNNGYTDELTIDRKNNDGNYEPSNCQWISMKNQYKNKQDSIYVIYNDEEWFLLDLLKHLNRSEEYDKIRSRIQRGWDVTKALNIPHNMKKHYYYFSKCLISEFENKEEDYCISKEDFVKKYFEKHIRIASYMLNKYIIEIMKEYGIKNNKFNFTKIKGEN